MIKPRHALGLASCLASLVVACGSSSSGGDGSTAGGAGTTAAGGSGAAGGAGGSTSAGSGGTTTSMGGGAGAAGSTAGAGGSGTGGTGMGGAGGGATGGMGGGGGSGPTCAVMESKGACGAMDGKSCTEYTGSSFSPQTVIPMCTMGEMFMKACPANAVAGTCVTACGTDTETAKLVYDAALVDAAKAACNQSGGIWM